mmetsp:Transcript_20040/g.35616  ORF Transcript_20040/g.35616 Transcript_20040/m.35616 type:complete len:94 (+) Transcript_20040:140-421(+)
MESKELIYCCVIICHSNQIISHAICHSNQMISHAHPLFSSRFGSNGWTRDGVATVTRSFVLVQHCLAVIATTDVSEWVHAWVSQQDKVTNDGV